MFHLPNLTRFMTLIPSAPEGEKINPRTSAALERLRNAMRDIEAEIDAHGGVYPFNHGRVTQSELCRRADVKKATLQTPLHKDSTRVDVMNWLDGLSTRLLQTRDATRERVTAVADDLAEQLAQLTQAHEATQAQLHAAQAHIEALQHDNARLQALVSRRD